MSYTNSLLLNKLKKFYIDDNLKNFLNYIKYDKISLRVIDWFVTNYSKKYDIIYLIYESDNNNYTIDGDDNYKHKSFNVYHSYKSQLKSYSKKNFDPFCRRDKINFEYKKTNGDYDCILTTLGQLNFFRWAIENKLIDYIKKNHKNIENDMNNSIKIVNKNKDNFKNIRKKRQELSLSASRGLNKHHGKIVITFD
jgi:hypothetical protein